ncbi:MAG: VWA domain-containing protein [Acidobacteria bacterium]|nr:VWA domain-containing protein [Acidobacteriota bacterium]
MKTDVRLSTKFLTAQGAHQVGVLVTLAGEAPARRAPINVALVLDRSGSMGGPPLAAAKEAAIRFARFLGPDDRLTVVTFDDHVRTIFGPAPAGDDAAAEAIAAVHEGGSTNLSGGWLKGRAHVEEGLVEGVNRVVLLTDGMANAGIVEPSNLVDLARGAATSRVSTTCIGFGAEFNEDLLRDMAAVGGANYWYVERDDQMSGIFDEEIEGLVALAAQNLEVEVALAHSAVAGVSFLQSYPVTRTAQGDFRIALGDLYATSARSIGLVFHVNDVGALGETKLAEVRVTADVVQPDGIAHEKLVMPVVANIDGADHVEPTVERTFVRFEAARAREEAVRLADTGDLDGAAQALAHVAATLSPYRAEPGVAEEMDDLSVSAQRLMACEYDASDRKYHGARSMALRDEKAAYLKKLSRRRPGPKP